MKNYIVVGGSSGIGWAITQQLHQQGNHVTVMSRTAPPQDLGKNVQHIVTDVTKQVSHDDLPEEVHGLVYCPGTIELKPFHRLTPDSFQRDWDINVMGAVKIIQSALKSLKKGKASIVLFSTVAARQGMPFHSSIATSKAALEGLGKSLAAEYAPTLRCNVIAPSLTDTPLAEKLLSTEQKRTAAAERHPLKKVATPEEIASLAAYLLSDQSAFITGQVLGADGGLGNVKL